ncbi:hypothetical protein HHI36_011398, partial [Cryptolaemus montrouzieri]
MALKKKATREELLQKKEGSRTEEILAYQNDPEKSEELRKRERFKNLKRKDKGTR